MKSPASRFGGIRHRLEMLRTQSLYHTFQNMIRPPSWRTFLARIEALANPRKTRKLDTPEAQSIYRAMRVNGHTEDLRPLSDGQVLEMKEFLMGQRMLDYSGADRGLFTFAGAPKDCATAYYPTETVVRIPHLFTFANNPHLLAAIENLFGCKPQIGVIQAFWRFPTQMPPVKDEYFHRDFETLRFVKCFLYLTDVTLDSGPHQFVEGSHRVNKYWKLGVAMDEDIEKAYGREKIIYKTGRAGTCFLEETNGWHKGTKPVHLPRLAIQVVYSINPSKYRDDVPISMEEIADQDIGDLDPFTFQNHVIRTGKPQAAGKG